MDQHLHQSSTKYEPNGDNIHALLTNTIAK